MEPARHVYAAYILDRAAQYDPGSGIVAALEEVAHAVATGEAEAAHAHGELDDLLPRVRAMRPHP